MHGKLSRTSIRLALSDTSCSNLPCFCLHMKEQQTHETDRDTNKIDQLHVWLKPKDVFAISLSLTKQRASEEASHSYSIHSKSLLKVSHMIKQQQTFDTKASSNHSLISRIPIYKLSHNQNSGSNIFIWSMKSRFGDLLSWCSHQAKFTRQKHFLHYISNLPINQSIPKRPKSKGSQQEYLGMSGIKCSKLSSDQSLLLAYNWLALYQHRAI